MDCSELLGNVFHVEKISSNEMTGPVLELTTYLPGSGQIHPTPWFDRSGQIYEVSGPFKVTLVVNLSELESFFVPSGNQGV